MCGNSNVSNRNRPIQRAAIIDNAWLYYDVLMYKQEKMKVGDKLSTFLMNTQIESVKNMWRPMHITKLQSVSLKICKLPSLDIVASSLRRVPETGTKPDSIQDSRPNRTSKYAVADLRSPGLDSMMTGVRSSSSGLRLASPRGGFIIGSTSPSPPGFIPDLGKKIMQYHELKNNEMLANKRYQRDQTTESRTDFREFQSPEKMSPVKTKSRRSHGSRAFRGSPNKYSSRKSKFFRINHLRDSNNA